MGIKVYTIGVGRKGQAPYPAVDMFGNQTMVMADVEIDEKLLTEIATMTGGKYFRAENNNALAEIYDEINLMERSEVQVTEHLLYEELFLGWLILAILVLVAEFALSYLILNRLP